MQSIDLKWLREKVPVFAEMQDRTKSIKNEQEHYKAHPGFKSNAEGRFVHA